MVTAATDSHATLAAMVSRSTKPKTLGSVGPSMTATKKTISATVAATESTAGTASRTGRASRPGQ